MANTKKTAIHVTAVKSFLRCRLSWFWSTEKPWGLYLEPVTKRDALALGTAVHKCMQVYYDQGVPLLETYSKAAAEQDLFEDTRDLGRQMLAGYENWAKTADQKLKFIATETTWRVRLNRYWLTGTYDALVEWDGGLWVMDFKTTGSQETSWTARDLQATAYVMAARALYGDDVRGIIFRFLRKKAPRDYHSLILKKGSVTQRKDIENNTTYENYLEALAVAVAAEIVPYPEEAAQQGVSQHDYCAKILKRGDVKESPWYPLFKEMFTNARRLYWDTLQLMRGRNPFYWDSYEYRTGEQLRQYAQHIFLPAMREMTSKSKRRWIGPTGLGSSLFVCHNCDFRGPCTLALDGADYKSILEAEYQRRTPR